jgi:hypothetical protein
MPGLRIIGSSIKIQGILSSQQTAGSKKADSYGENSTIIKQHGVVAVAKEIQLCHIYDFICKFTISCEKAHGTISMYDSMSSRIMDFNVLAR